MATGANGQKLESRDAACLFNQIECWRKRGWVVDRLWYEDRCVPGRWWGGRWVRFFYAWIVEPVPTKRIVTHFGPVVERG